LIIEVSALPRRLRDFVFNFERMGPLALFLRGIFDFLAEAILAPTSVFKFFIQPLK
jgi:hypothetical protein